MESISWRCAQRPVLFLELMHGGEQLVDALLEALEFQVDGGGTAGVCHGENYSSRCTQVNEHGGAGQGCGRNAANHFAVSAITIIRTFRARWRPRTRSPAGRGAWHSGRSAVRAGALPARGLAGRDPAGRQRRRRRRSGTANPVRGHGRGLVRRADGLRSADPGRGPADRGAYRGADLLVHRLSLRTGHQWRRRSAAPARRSRRDRARSDRNHARRRRCHR